MITVTVWRSSGGQVQLHPDFTTKRDQWVPLRCRLVVGATVIGRWWPFVRKERNSWISTLEPSLIETIEGPSNLSNDEDESSCHCELKKKEPPAPVAAPALNGAEVRALLARQSTSDVLAAEYGCNPHVRRAVEESLASASNDSQELTNACLVAEMVMDPHLWEPLAARAREGHRVAEACLRDIADERGVAYFRAALEPAADVPLGCPLLGNALHFFIANCIDQGLDCLGASLGNPLTTKARTQAAKYGRLEIGRVLRYLEEIEETPVREEWCEYVAACLLTERFVPEEGWSTSDGLALLRAHKDPRTPVVMHRLIRDHMYDEEDVVPSLTVVTSGEAQNATRQLLAETIRARRRAQGDEANRLEWLEELLRSAASELGVEA